MLATALAELRSPAPSTARGRPQTPTPLLPAVPRNASPPGLLPRNGPQPCLPARPPRAARRAAGRRPPASPGPPEEEGYEEKKEE